MLKAWSFPFELYELLSHVPAGRFFVLIVRFFGLWFPCGLAAVSVCKLLFFSFCLRYFRGSFCVPINALHSEFFGILLYLSIYLSIRGFRPD